MTQKLAPLNRGQRAIAPMTADNNNFDGAQFTLNEINDGVTTHRKLRDLGERLGLDIEKRGGDRCDIVRKSERGYSALARNLTSNEAFRFLQQMAGM